MTNLELVDLVLPSGPDTRPPMDQDEGVLCLGIYIYVVYREIVGGGMGLERGGVHSVPFWVDAHEFRWSSSHLWHGSQLGTLRFRVSR